MREKVNTGGNVEFVYEDWKPLPKNVEISKDIKRIYFWKNFRKKFAEILPYVLVILVFCLIIYGLFIAK